MIFPNGVRAGVAIQAVTWHDLWTETSSLNRLALHPVSPQIAPSPPVCLLAVARTPSLPPPGSCPLLHASPSLGTLSLTSSHL